MIGGEKGIRTLETVLAAYTISNRAPSTNSDISPLPQKPGCIGHLDGTLDARLLK